MCQEHADTPRPRRSIFRFCLFLVTWLVLVAAGLICWDVAHFLRTPGCSNSAPPLAVLENWWFQAQKGVPPWAIPGKEPSEPAEVQIGIEPGDTFIRVAWKLKQAGAITDVSHFILLGKYENALGTVKAGEYLVNTGWTPDRVLYQVTKGRAVLYRLTLREGLAWWETAKDIEEQGFAKAEDLAAVVKDPAFLVAHHIPFATAEGFLFPDTYLLKKPKALDAAQAEAVAGFLADSFWRQNEEVWARLPVKQGGRAVERRFTKDGRLIRPEPARNDTNAAGPPAPAEQEAPTADTGAARPADKIAPGSSPVAGQNTPAATATPPGNAPAADAAATPAGGQNATLPAPAGAAASSRNATAADVTAPPAGGQNTTLPATAVAATSVGNATAGRQNATLPAPASRHTTALPADPGRLILGPATPADVDPEALKRLIILASLVEKETGVPDERARVAGVYAKRLEKSMLLQCDPTIIYGVGPSFSGAIKRSQLEDANNRYNTYKHPGLPPGPICSPGLASLRAALEPEKNDYLYFVATGTDGRHVFSKTLEEHNRAVQAYRRTQGR